MSWVIGFLNFYRCFFFLNVCVGTGRELEEQGIETK